MRPTLVLVALLLGVVHRISTAPVKTDDAASQKLELVWLDDLVDTLSGNSGGSKTNVAERLAKGESKAFKERIRDYVLSKSHKLIPAETDDWTQTGVQVVDPATGLSYIPDWAQLSRSSSSNDQAERVQSTSESGLRAAISENSFTSDENCWIYSREVTSTDYLQDSNDEVSSKWVLFSEVVPGSARSPAEQYVISVVYADPLSWLRQRYNEDTNNGETVSGKVGLQVVASRADTGEIKWTSGSGDIGFVDGSRNNARFSSYVTSLSFLPSCNFDDYTAQINDTATNRLINRCPVTSRPGFFRADQFIYMADSGNCAIRLLNWQSGRVITRWGKSGCIPEAQQNDTSLYVDSNFGDRVTLGRNLTLAWASWKFLIIVDKDANRIRKHVPSQHQGLSNLAGTGEYDCSASPTTPVSGTSAKFCRPDAVAVTSDGSRAVVSEQYDSSDWTLRRIRILDFSFTYLPGGDVDNVDATVTMVSPHPYFDTNMRPSYFFTAFGGMRLTPDGNHLVAGSSDPIIHPFLWIPGEIRKDYLLVVDLASGHVRGINKTTTALFGQPVGQAGSGKGYTIAGIDDYSDPNTYKLITLQHELLRFPEPGSLIFYYVSTTPKLEVITVERSGANRFDSVGSCGAVFSRQSSGLPERAELRDQDRPLQASSRTARADLLARLADGTETSSSVSQEAGHVGVVDKGQVRLLHLSQILRVLRSNEE